MGRRTASVSAMTAATATATAISAAWGVAGSPANAAIDPPPTLRQRGGVIVLKVPDYNAACRLIVDAAASGGGEVRDARTDVKENGRRHGWLRVVVPADKLTDFLPRVRAVGTLYAERMATTDNKSEYGSLARRVSRLQQHEGRLSGVLQTRKNLRGSDVLFLQERLFRASVDESLLAQQHDDLAQKGETSAVTVELFEPTPIRARDRASRSATQAWGAARERAGDAAAALAHRALTVAAFALAFAPLYLSALLAAALIGLWARRRWRSWRQKGSGRGLFAAENAGSVPEVVARE